MIQAFERGFVFKYWFSSDHESISRSVILINSISVFAYLIFSIFVCLRWCIYLQSYTLFIGRIFSWTKSAGLECFTLVLWYVYCTVNGTVARIPIHGSTSYTNVSCRFYVCTRFPSNWCIISMISFACGFLGKIVLIPYLFSIKLFLTLDWVILLLGHTWFILAVYTRPST